MKFENTEVFNIEGAIRGMRNPMNSWAKSDSGNGCCSQSGNILFTTCDKCEWNSNNCGYSPYYILGGKDLELAKKLVKAGPSDRKFLRQIFVSVDITAPLYW